MRSRTYIIEVPSDRWQVGFGTVILIVFLVGVVAFFAGTASKSFGGKEENTIQQPYNIIPGPTP